MTAFPAAFEERMKQSLQAEWESFFLSHEQEPPVGIRVNPSKPSKISGEAIPWTRYGKYLAQRPVFTLDPSFHAGAYYVQEPSSMMLEQVMQQVVDLTKPLRVLDLCAAPGGKSTHVLSLLSPESLLVSNEAIRSRASILYETLQKWGYPNVVITNNDPEDFSRLSGFFDVIVVDAPCSGEGLFRKDQNARVEWSIENADLCAARQRRILSDVWPALKNSGILIYCTCTYNPQENEQNLEWLKEQQDMEFISLNVVTPGIEVVDQPPALKFLPHRVAGEGFFIAAVRKLSGETGRFHVRKKLPVASRPTLEKLSDWLTDPQHFEIVKIDELLVAIPKLLLNEIEFVGENLKIVSRGTALATAKHDKLIPEHAAALSIALNQDNFPKIKMDLATALGYLRKETPAVETDQKGFAMATYNDLPIGWMNILDKRYNNLYPANWRIRMGA